MMSNLRRIAVTVGAALLVSGVGMSAFAADAPAPKKVAILLFKGVQIIDYSGPYEVFADAGYDVFTVGATKDPVTTSGGDGHTVTPKYTFVDAPQADIVIIPGGGGAHAAPGKTPAVLDWIRSEALHAKHVMSVCSGAF